MSIAGGTDGRLSRPPLVADGPDAVRDVGPDLRDAAPRAGQHRRHPGRLRRHRRSRGEGQDRARSRPRPADRRAIRPVDRRPVARRSRLCLCLGEAGDRGDPAAHPDQRQARRHGAVLRRHHRRAVRRHQRGAAEHAARLFPARAQPQRSVVAVVLARPAGADGVRATGSARSRSTTTRRAASCRSSACWPFRRPGRASAARR